MSLTNACLMCMELEKNTQQKYHKRSFNRVVLNGQYTANLGTSEWSPILKMLSFQFWCIIYIFICSYSMKPGYHWSFWTTGFWMALKFFSWNLSHSHKPLINFCCKFVHFSITKALFNFVFYQIFTHLVSSVLSFSSHSGGRVGEGPGKWWGWALTVVVVANVQV